MDYIEGDTLEAYLDQRGRLPVAEALRLTMQLAGALDYAHGNGRIHRDVKPGNVMFADADHQHAVVTDFGLTRLLDNATITLSGTIAGTPAYMSPESAQGQKVDARSDIYSLGVMLYEMVTGQRPYLGETPLSVIMKLVLEPLPPARTVNPDLPPELDAVLQKAMAKLPEDRYQTAAELQMAVQEVASGQVASGEVASRQVASERVASAQNDSGSIEPERTQMLPPEPVRRKAKRPFLPIAAGIGLLVVLMIAGFIFLNGPDVKAVVEATATAEAVPTLAIVTQAATPPVGETAVFTPAGTLRFAAPDANNLRQYTLSLDDVPPPPAGFHYELWFDFSGQPAPENVAEVVARNGRVTYADVLVENLAATVTNVRISLEPDFDDDPTISADVIFTGTVAADAGLAEIEMFGIQP
jgi:serine/threonine-protein kinase